MPKKILKYCIDMQHSTMILLIVTAWLLWTIAKSSPAPVHQPPTKNKKSVAVTVPQRKELDMPPLPQLTQRTQPKDIYPDQIGFSSSPSLEGFSGFGGLSGYPLH